jgi:hypothetical protein
MHNFRIKHNTNNGIHFLWFTWFNTKHYCFIWECGEPIWWLPKFIKEKYSVHFGWLIFQVGFGWH